MSPLNDRLDALTHKLIHKNNVEGLGLNGNPVLLGWAQRTSDSSTNGATFVDVPGLSVTVTVPAGRVLRISLSAFVYSTVVNDSIYVRILEDGVKIKDLIDPDLEGAFGDTIEGTVLSTPAAGTHTYKIQIARAGGTGFANLAGRTDNPAIFTVEDITGNQLPYNPLSVPVGVLAQATNFGNGFGTTSTTPVAITGGTVNIVVPAGRLLRISGKAHVYINVTNGRPGLAILQDGAVVNESFLTMPVSGSGNDMHVYAYVSPSAGAHTYQLAVASVGGATTNTYSNPPDSTTYLIVEDITPTPAPAYSAPSASLGYIEGLTQVTGITTTEVAVGPSLTVPVPSGRRLKITARVSSFSSVDDDVVRVTLYEDGGVVAGESYEVVGGWGTARSIEWIRTPAAGNHTYTLTIKRDSGTGTITFQTAWILVEDITSVSVNPTVTVPGLLVVTSASRPSSPTVGTVIYETDTGKMLLWNGVAWDDPRNIAAGYLTGYNDLNGTAAYALSKSATEAVIATTPAIQTYANRRYKITGTLTLNSGGSSFYSELRIRRGTTTAGAQQARMIASRPPASMWASPIVFAYDVPGAQASQQWVLTHAFDSSVGDIYGPVGVFVEDVGAA